MYVCWVVTLNFGPSLNLLTFFYDNFGPLLCFFCQFRLFSFLFMTSYDPPSLFKMATTDCLFFFVWPLMTPFICFMPTLVGYFFMTSIFLCVKCRWIFSLCYDNLGWFFLFLWPFMLKLFFAFSFLWTLVWPPLFFFETTKGCFFPLFYYLCQLWLVTSLFYDLHFVCVMTPLFYDNLGWFLLFLWPMPPSIFLLI